MHPTSFEASAGGGAGSAPPPTDSPKKSGERLRWGRERGPGAPGERLLARLGPPSADLATYHNQTPLVDGPKANGTSPAPTTPQPQFGVDTPLEELHFVALDCETTGHFPHRMVELGAVRFRCPGADDQPTPRLLLESLVHTTDHINPYARRVHGITRSMLTGAPPLRRVARTYQDFARGAVPIEHSADAFDTRLVAKALDRPLPHFHLDTSRLAGFLFELRDTIGLERLCERLGVTHRQPHYALADAEATADCFLELVRLGRDQHGWRTLGDLVAVAMPPEPRPVERPRARHPHDAAATAEPHGASDGAHGRRRRRRGGRRRHGPPPSGGDVTT